MQKLELTWIGKGQEPAVEPRILLHDTSRDYGDPNTSNMLIHGDNLLALKALEQEFAGQVKCVYIEIITSSLIQSDVPFCPEPKRVQAREKGCIIALEGCNVKRFAKAA